MAVATPTGIQGGGSVVPAGGTPSQVIGDSDFVARNTPPVLTAKFPMPSDNTQSPPVVVNSGAANDHIQNMQNASDALANDGQALASHNAANQPAPTDTGATGTDQTKPDDISSQISDIIGNLGTDTGAQGTVNDEQNTVTEDQQAIADLTDQQNNLYDTMNGYSTGSVPLTANEQSQVADVAQKYSGALSDAIKYATTVTAGATTAAARSALQMYSPAMAAAEIRSAVEAGQQRIDKVNSAMVDAQGKLSTALLNNDYKSATQAYTQLGNLIKDRQNEISTVNIAIDRAQTQMQNAQRDSLTALMDENTISYQQKQQALAQSTLDEKTKMDIQTLADEKLKNNIDAATLALNQQKENFAESQALGANSGINIPGLPQVIMNGDNTVNSAQQTDFLSKLNPDVATLVKKIDDYEINPNAIPTRQFKGSSGMTQQQMLALVSQYDPTYDEKSYATRQALKTNFATGKYSQNINALNTAIGHLVDLQSNTQGLGNAGFTPYNAAKNKIETLFGAGNVARASTNINAAVGELATTFKGSGATDAEIKNLGSVDANSSPEQVQAFVESATQLLASRLNALEDTYTQGMGKAPDKSFLSDSAAQGLLKLQQSGYNIQVPQLANTPQVKLQTFHDSDPKNAALVDQIMKAQPNLKPEDVVNILANNGIQL